MQKTVVIICLAVVSEAYSLRVDYSLLNKISEKKVKKKSFLNAPAKTTNAKNLDTSLVNFKEDNLVATITSLNTLIKATKNPKARLSLLLNRAKTYSAFGKKVFISQAGKNNSSVKGDKYFLASEKDADDVLKSSSASNSEKGKAYYFVGISRLYRGKEAAPFFKLSIKLKPSSEYVGWIGYYLSDTAFEKRNYKESIFYANKYFKFMTTGQKSLALYKKAWAYLNLNKQKESVSNFVKVLKVEPDGGVAQDVLKDLASMASGFKRSKNILSFANKTFTGALVKFKPDFIKNIVTIYDANGRLQFGDAVFNKALSFAGKNNNEKMSLYLGALSSNRTDFASKKYSKALKIFFKRVVREKLLSDKQVLAKYSGDIKSEMQNYMKINLDTYTGKLKSTQGISKKTLARNIYWVSSLYEKYFLNDEKMPVFYTSWEGVCFEQSNYTCLKNFKSLDSKSMKFKVFGSKLFRQLDNDILLLTYRAYKKDKKRNSKIFNKELSTYFKSNKITKTNLPMSRIYSDVLIEQKSWLDLAAHQRKVFKVTKSIKDFQRLQLAYFNLKKYKKIVSDPLVARYAKKDKTIASIKKESLLAMAQTASDSENSADFESNLKQFIDLSDDKKKKVNAVKTLIEHQITKKEFTKAAKLLSSQGSLKHSSELSYAQQTLWNHYMLQTDYKNAYKLVSGAIKLKLKNKSYLEFLTLFALNSKSIAGALKGLPSSERLEALKLSSALEPNAAIAFFTAKPPSNSSEKYLAEVALKLTYKAAFIKKTKLSYRVLGSNYDYLVPSYESLNFLRIESSYKKIKFPKYTDGQDPLKYAGVLKDLAESVRQLRKPLKQSIVSVNGLVKKRALEIAAKVEDRTAKLIKLAPPPKGLSEGVLFQYKDGIQKLASEFSNTAVDIRQSISKIKDDRKIVNKNSLLRDVDFGDWPSVESENDDLLDRVNKELSSKKYNSALVLLDIMKSSKEINSESYYVLRTKILISFNNSQAMKDFVKDELIAKNQKKLLNIWLK